MSMDAGLMTYDCQKFTNAIEQIEELAKSVSKPDTDSRVIQLDALRFWSANAQAMKKFQHFSKEDINQFKLERLKRLVDFAYEKVPFYRQLYTSVGYEPGAIASLEDFSKLPIVTKRQLREFEMVERVSSPHKIISTPSTRTSGSSGTPFISFHDQPDILRDYSEVLRFYNSCLKRPLESGDWIYLIHHAGLWVSSFDGTYRTFQLPDLFPATPLGQHLEFLRPRVISTLPSYLPLIKEMGLRLSDYGVEAIVTNSEYSPQSERDFYARELGVAVFDEYSSEEFGLIATQCSHGMYHVVEDGVHVEIIDKDASELGTVICTDLNNWFMPLIRFEHGDLAREVSAHEACSCGRHGARISEVNGRSDDAFLTADNRVVPSASILAAVDDVLVEHDLNLNEFRVIQTSATDVLLQTIYSGPTYCEMPKLLGHFNERLIALFGYSVNLHHQEVAALADVKSYKRKCLVRDWSKSNHVPG